jgi:glyoxylase-like metal-dependent hydrolase (beta-lactamase superfamily II)/rhodanese-related sulfurtransferase
MVGSEIAETIDMNTLRDLLEQGAPVTLLDVRPAIERAEWRIPGSIHVDAYEALKAQDPEALAGVELPAGRPVVALCGAGVTSLTAARQLRARGLDAVSLEGGMKAWSLAWNSAEVTLPEGGTRVMQLRRTGKGCLSYVIGSAGEAIVVDPSLEPEVYVRLARENGWRITKVIDTHIHADHLSRGRLLAEAIGASLHLPANERATFPFEAVREGDVLTAGEARLAMVATPGHTPESAAYLLHQAGLLDGRALFTGDTLFLEGVGRPDLEADPAEAEQRARALFQSLRRLQGLGEDVLLLPGHTSEPVAFDGRALAATLKDVQRQVARLQMGEDEFVASLLAHLPPTPPNHSLIVTLNEAGRWPEGDVTDREAGANRCAVR